MMDGAALLMTGAISQTFLMQTVADKPWYVYVAFQISIYVALAGTVGFLGTRSEDFMGVGTQPDVKPGFYGWWYNPDIGQAWFKIAPEEQPWYIHAGNVYYGLSNSITAWVIWQCMIVKEKVSHGNIHAKIACMAFCSGAIGHISQYMGFNALDHELMPMKMRVFVYFQGMVTSFYPVNWIVYNRCQQSEVNYTAKLVMIFLAGLQTLLFTSHESGFFESLSIGPNDMAYSATQGWWHFQHSVMHFGYVGAAVLCYATMPAEASKPKRK